MPQFKEGDVVKLNSGGPLMTVSAVTNDGVEVHWFNHDSATWEIKWTNFKASMLTNMN